MQQPQRPSDFDVFIDTMDECDIFGRESPASNALQYVLRLERYAEYLQELLRQRSSRF